MKKILSLSLFSLLLFSFTFFNDKDRTELINGIKKIKSGLENKLKIAAENQLPYALKKTAGADNKCDSIVDMGIYLKSPNRYYSVSISCSYHRTNKEAKKAFTENYKATMEAEKHSEGDKSPHAHFLIGNEIYNISYGCSLNGTQSEKDVLVLFNGLYEKNKSVSSFWINHCGSGISTSEDLK